MPGTLPALTPAQIAGVVKYGMQNTGSFVDTVTFPNPDTSGPVFVAIALVESSGIPDNIGGPNSNGSHDYGLWQINDKAHPDIINPSNNEWKIPQRNYEMAVRVYVNAGNKFTPWSTYKSGLYATRMVEATEAWQHPDLSAHTASAITDTTNTVVIRGERCGRSHLRSHEIVHVDPRRHGSGRRGPGPRRRGGSHEIPSPRTVGNHHASRQSE
jgi:hypothetical protein